MPGRKHQRARSDWVDLMPTKSSAAQAEPIEPVVEIMFQDRMHKLKDSTSILNGFSNWSSVWVVYLREKSGEYTLKIYSDEKDGDLLVTADITGSNACIIQPQKYRDDTCITLVPAPQAIDSKENPKDAEVNDPTELSRAVILGAANKKQRGHWMDLLLHAQGITDNAYRRTDIVFQGYLTKEKGGLSDFFPALSRKLYTLVMDTLPDGTKIYELRSYASYGDANPKKTLFTYRMKLAGKSDIHDNAFFIISQDASTPLFFVAKNELERDTWLQNLLHVGVTMDDIKNTRPLKVTAVVASRHSVVVGGQNKKKRAHKRGVSVAVGDCFVAECPNMALGHGYCDAHMALRPKKHGRRMSNLFVESKKAEINQLNAKLAELQDDDDKVEGKTEEEENVMAPPDEYLPEDDEEEDDAPPPPDVDSDNDNDDEPLATAPQEAEEGNDGLMTKSKGLGKPRSSFVE